MADREGFEPSRRYKRLHAFQACAFSHSATCPWRFVTSSARQYQEKAVLFFQKECFHLQVEGGRYADFIRAEDFLFHR